MIIVVGVVVFALLFGVWRAGLFKLIFKSIHAINLDGENFLDDHASPSEEEPCLGCGSSFNIERQKVPHLPLSSIKEEDLEEEKEAKSDLLSNEASEDFRGIPRYDVFDTTDLVKETIETAIEVAGASGSIKTEEGSILLVPPTSPSIQRVRMGSEEIDRREAMLARYGVLALSSDNEFDDLGC